jgi:DNA-binding MarR family transcriptional regulator
MAKPYDDVRLDLIRDAIIHQSDNKPGRIARLLGMDNKTVQRALAQLEQRGDLLAEDEKGRLTWVGRRSD